METPEQQEDDGSVVYTLGDKLFLSVVGLLLSGVIAIVCHTYLNSWTVVQRSDGKYSFRSGSARLHRWRVYDTCEQANKAMNIYRQELKKPVVEEPDPFTYRRVKCE